MTLWATGTTQVAFLYVYEDLCAALETTWAIGFAEDRAWRGRPVAEPFVMSIEKGAPANGGVAWRMRWHEGGHNRVRQFSRKRDAEGLDADIWRR